MISSNQSVKMNETIFGKFRIGILLVEFNQITIDDGNNRVVCNMF